MGGEGEDGEERGRRWVKRMRCKGKGNPISTVWMGWQLKQLSQVRKNIRGPMPPGRGGPPAIGVAN